tara:strand:- start:334 stop:1329 length:996 start_codon:yes stop_codon:yes gene_type:complete
MTTPPLEQSLKLAEAAKYEPSRCGFDLCRNILAGVREARVRRPDLVIKFGTYLVDQFAQRLGHEAWTVYEQVYVAMLEYGKQRPDRGKAKRDAGESESSLAMAQEFCNVLSVQFPKSLRVKRLEAMMWEAKGELDMAMKDYEDILKEDENNLFALKRQVALLRSRGQSGDLNKAASKLVEHIEVVSSDTDSWLQLSEMYLNAVLFRRSMFCMEELLLVNPMSYMYHLRYAELLYTVACGSKGGLEQFRLARKYFAHALELKPQHNLRALYGLLLCCAAMGGVKGKSAKESGTAELLAFVQPALQEEYAACGGKHAEPMLKMVKGMIDTLAA